MAMVDPLALPYTSLRGSRATQTLTSTSVCSTPLTEVVISRGDLATHKPLHHKTNCGRSVPEPRQPAQYSEAQALGER